MQFARALLMVFGLATFAACGGDSLADECKDACDNPCQGETVDNVDQCKKDCDAGAAELKASGCEDKANEANDCLDVKSCESATTADLERCQSEVTAFGQCLQDYCANNASSEACQS